MQHPYTSVLSPSVADKIPVGRREVLDSPHVSEGPGRIANAPVPSVFHDDRGSIHRLKVGDRRINLLHSNEGVMRSGYLHNMEKSMFVVSGEVELWLLKDDDTEKLTLKEFDSVRIPPYVPHVLHFPAGKAVTAEWWQPKQNGEDLQCWFYHPYRRIVDVQNSMVSRSTGRHSLLVPQDMQKLHDQQSEKGRIHPFYGSVVSWTFGLVTGIVIGTLLSTSPPSSSRN